MFHSLRMDSRTRVKSSIALLSVHRQNPNVILLVPRKLIDHSLNISLTMESRCRIASSRSDVCAAEPYRQGDRAARTTIISGSLARQQDRVLALASLSGQEHAQIHGERLHYGHGGSVQDEQRL